jgi:FkbM family methyltransferase
MRPRLAIRVRRAIAPIVWKIARTSARGNDGLYWSHVVLGPLRGARFAMPALERPAYALGTYERHVVSAMRTHVVAGATAYDIGAHVGYLTLVLSRIVGPSGTVFAFEPDPRNREVLARNLAMNGARNVELSPLAVSEVSGMISFATFPGYSTVGHLANAETPSDAEVISVGATTIDEFIFQAGHPAPSLVKIDVEGAEDKVLRGATETLARIRPTIICEVRGDVWEPVLSMMRSAQYSAHVLPGLEGAVVRGRRTVTDVLFSPLH